MGRIRRALQRVITAPRAGTAPGANHIEHVAVVEWICSPNKWQRRSTLLSKGAAHLQVPPGASFLPAVRAVPLRKHRLSQVLSWAEHCAWPSADLLAQCIPLPRHYSRYKLRDERAQLINQRQQAQRSCACLVVVLG